MIRTASNEGAEYVSRHCLPLGIKTNSSKPLWEGAYRGTFTLLKAGKRHVFVTCHHVLRALREAQKEDPSALLVAYDRMPLGGRMVVAEYNTFQLVDDSETLDVAVFRGLLDIIRLSDLPFREFVNYKTSYLPDPRPGEMVMIVRYPGENISVTPTLMDLGYMVIGLSALSVVDRYVYLANERGDRKFTDYTNPPRNGVSLGGVSGSPAFVIRDQNLRFIGIVSECSPTSDIICVSRLGCLKDDGTLDHLMII